MTFLQRIADWLIINPTTDPIDTDDRERLLLPMEAGNIEVWVTRSNSESENATAIVILKFPGAGGRAERGRPHPAEVWPNIDAEIWTINHRGFGGSTGPASIQNFAMSCETVWKAAIEKFSDRKIVVIGNSLGCLSAMYLAARYPATAAYFRNPPALAQMIATRRRYTWWNFGMSRIIADQVPDELDPVANAQNSTCPALFVRSELDRVVPVEYQEMVIQAYAGDQRLFVIRGADHHHRVSEEQQNEYLEALEWLGGRIVS